MPGRTIALLLMLGLVAGSALAQTTQRSSNQRPPNFAATPIQQNAAWTKDWWRKRHDAKAREAKKADVDLLFVGDSITQGWENAGAAVWRKHYASANAFNLGFSGDRTEHVLWRLHNGAIDHLSPSLVVLMIGTNNTGQRMDPADYTAQGIERIVDVLRQRLPETRILILGIFPRQHSPHNDMRRRNNAINTRIAKLADGQAVRYLDIGRAFLKADDTLRGDLMPDLLHLNAEGYRAWAEAMAPVVQDMLGVPTAVD